MKGASGSYFGCTRFIKTSNLTCCYKDMKHDTPTIFSALLAELEVPYTPCYSDRQFRQMPFKSLFGMQRLLHSYGIDSAGFRVADNADLLSLPVPYVAQTARGVEIVTDIDPDRVITVTDSGARSMPRADFTRDATGVVLAVYPDEKSIEPGYVHHRRMMLIERMKGWAIWGALLFLLVWLYISGELYRSAGPSLLIAVDMAGLYMSYLLILKQLHFESAAADRVCGVIQTHGCNKVLDDKASSFFGIFHWSEVGATYFSVSLITLLLFPALAPQLALINLCALPFTLWSVWYQHFRVHAWCTMCLSVQALLWCQFGCYLLAGATALAWPPLPVILPLGAGYIAVLLILNRTLAKIPQPQ